MTAGAAYISTTPIGTSWKPSPGPTAAVHDGEATIWPKSRARFAVHQPTGSRQNDMSIALGMALGVGLGAAVGATVEEVPLGVALGIAVGAGVAFGMRSGR